MTNESLAGNPYGPYPTSSELPVSVRRRLPQPAQEVFRAAYNRCLQEFNDVEHAGRIAWTAATRGHEKRPDGTWVERTGDPEADRGAVKPVQPRRRRLL